MCTYDQNDVVMDINGINVRLTFCYMSMENKTEKIKQIHYDEYTFLPKMSNFWAIILKPLWKRNWSFFFYLPTRSAAQRLWSANIRDGIIWIWKQYAVGFVWFDLWLKFSMWMYLYLCLSWDLLLYIFFFFGCSFLRWPIVVNESNTYYQWKHTNTKITAHCHRNVNWCRNDPRNSLCFSHIVRCAVYYFNRVEYMYLKKNTNNT